MKAITLYQPWATSVAVKAKKIETRSWGTTYRGPLAIHAGVNKKYVDPKSNDYLCDKEPFSDISMNFADYWDCTTDAYPRGTILAIVELQNCVQIREIGPANIVYLSNGNCWVLTDREKAFGDYREGRYMWFLSEYRHRIFRLPILTKGHQRLWEWEPLEV